jgi:subtilisin family serine protease
MVKQNLYRILSLLLIAIILSLPVRSQQNAVRYQIKKNSNFNTLLDNKSNKHRYFKDTLIVKFKTNTSKSSIDKFAKRRNLDFVKKISKDTYLYKLSKSVIEKDLPKLLNLKNEKIKTYSEDNEIEIIDIDEMRKINSTNQKNQPQVPRKRNFLAKQWYLDNDGINGLKKDADINAKQAWLKSQGQGIIVAVIDTGFDLGHPDINYYNAGYDVIKKVNNASAPVSSEENHGTAVAGLIAAKNNEVGVTGVAPEAKVFPIRMIDDGGFVPVSSIIEAHYKAVEMGARIISNSWGSYDPDLPIGSLLELTEIEKLMYQDIYENSHNGKGTLIVFSAGNNSFANLYNAPEARIPYTLAVGATDSTDQRLSFSNFGQGLDLVAPGGGFLGIYTTDRRDIFVKSKGKKKKQIKGYQKGDYASNFSGTSASAPLVAGIAALVLSLKPDLTAYQIREVLINSANKNLHPRYSFDENGWNNEVGYGRVDALNALIMTEKL